MSSKKLCFVGNTNNISSVPLRYLIDLGIDAELILLSNEDQIFDPWVDGCDSHTCRDKIRKVGWGSIENWFKEDRGRIYEDLSRYDIVVGTDLSAAYCSAIGVHLDVFCPHGGDLSVMPFPHLTRPQRQIQVLDIARHQADGIRSSTLVQVQDKNEFKRELADLKKGDQEIKECIPPLVYAPSFSQAHDGSLVHEQFSRLRKECDILIISPIRHVWGWQLNPINYKAGKGNDKLIRAIHTVRKEFPSLRIKVIVFEYGMSVKRSKRLIKDLGLEDIFVWFPCIPRTKLYYGLGLSDLVVGELGVPFLSSSSIQESLLCGVPFLGMRDDRLYTHYKDLYNMLNAFEVPVDRLLCEFIRNSRRIKALTSSNRSWAMKNCAWSSLQVYSEVVGFDLPAEYDWLSRYGGVENEK